MTLLLNIKYKSFALFFAICISLILLFFTSTFIMSSLYDRLNILSFTKRHQLMLNVNSGVNLFLSNKDEYPINQTQAFSPFYNNDSISIVHYKWGIFDVAAVSSAWKGYSEKKSVMTGEIIDSTIAFYLSDNSSILMFSGGGVINGDCYLSEKGYRTTSVEGKSFYGQKAIAGKQLKNMEIKLRLKEVCDTINKFLFQSNGRNKLISWNSIESDTLINSFNDSTKVYYSISSINLTNFLISGNIKIVSDHSIYLDQSTQLNDAIVIAPYIYIDENFVGKGQFFAKDSIIVDTKVRLSYPSVLGLLKLRNLPTSQRIVLSDGATFSGCIINFSENYDYMHQPMTIVGENVDFKGQIISNGIVSFKSNINGQLFCGELYYASQSSFYKNLILDYSIDVKKLPIKFSGLQPISSKNTGNRFIKWLH